VKQAEYFPPSEYIRDEMVERGWSDEDLAGKALIPVSRVKEILAGATIMLSECERLAVAFGTSLTLFANLQVSWRRRPEME
jgi:plasmid maintenance system antidote protein VapI